MDSRSRQTGHVVEGLPSTGHRTTTNRTGSWTIPLGLLFVLLVGLALRLIYLVRVNPSLDEYSSLITIQSIVDHGVPLLPSGLVNGNGILYSYASAATALFWSDRLADVRSLSLLVSLGTIALTFVIGRRLFSARAGLVAAAFLALAPESVLWGARGRAYAMAQALALVAFWLYYTGVLQERKAWRRAGLLALMAAVLARPEAALLLPGLAMAVLALQGRRWLVSREHLLELILAGAGVIGLYSLQRVVTGGGVGQFDTISRVQSAFGLLANWTEGLDIPAELLLLWPILVTTVLALFAVLGLSLRRSRDPRAYSVRFLAIVLATITLQMILITGATDHNIRWLFLTFPLLFLMAGVGVDVLAAWLTALLPDQAVKAILVTAFIAIGLPLSTAVLRAANTAETAFELAFDYVGEHWSSGDRIATLAPAAAWISLGQVDYFAIGKDYEEFVFQKNGVWSDKWVGSRLLHTTAELDSVLDEAAATNVTLWLVTDESRLSTFYDTDFVQMIWDRMSLVYADEQAQVFQSEPHRLYTLEENAPRRETFAGRIALAGYAVGDPAQAGSPSQGELVVGPNQSLPLRLTWQALVPLADTYVAFVHLIGEDGQRYGQLDGLPLGGHYPLHLWEPDIRYSDRWAMTLPETLTPGRYRLEIGLYHLETGDRLPPTQGPGRLPADTLILDFLNIPDGQATHPPDALLSAELGGAIRLQGISPDLSAITVHPGDDLALTLHWQAITPTAEAYTLFVHLVDERGTIIAQYDGEPQGGFYPTSFWDPGETLEDRIELSLPADSVPGTYKVVAGLYRWATGDRLGTTGGESAPGDVIQLGVLNVR